MTPEELEARINAHREVIIDLLAALLGDERARQALERLAGDETVVDSEEDPGAVPDRAFALESLAATEVKAIRDAARARAAAQ